MWFKNLQVYRLSTDWDITFSRLEEQLAQHAFVPGTSMDMTSSGWRSPLGNGALVHEVNRQLLFMFTVEKRLLPASVINQVAKERALELEEQQGYRPGKKQMKEIKQHIVDELMPRAFCIRRNTYVWIDPVNGWLVVDAASPAKADEVFGLLVKSVDNLPARTLRVKIVPSSGMTNWLLSDEAPYGFTIDQDTELRSKTETKSAVRYIRHSLDAKEVREHIEAGKECVKLAMTWNDKVSFVLTDALAIKRVAPLDVLKEKDDAVYSSEEEAFDTDFALMTGELNAMLADLTAALGGEAN